MDYHIGYDALKHTDTHDLSYPIREGIISNWELMEKIWHKSIFDILRAVCF